MIDSLKESIVFLIISIINFCIAYFITTSLGIQDIILFESYSAMGYCITYEFLIWFPLTFIGSALIEKIKEEEQYI